MKNLIDSVYYNAGNFIYLGSQWLISVLLVRFGGFEDAGIFSLVMSVNSIVVIIGNFNLRTYQVSDYKNRFSDYTYLLSRWITIGLSIVVCFIYSVLMSYEGKVIALMLVYAVYKGIEAYSDVLGGVWQKNNNMLSTGMSLGMKGVVNFASFMLVYAHTKDLLLSVCVMMLSSLLVMIFFDFHISKKYLKQTEAIRQSNMQQVVGLMKTGLLTMLANLFVVACSAISKIMVEKLMDERSLGIFSSISTPTVIISTFAFGMLLPIAPKMAELYETKKRKELLITILKCNSVFVGVGILATICSFFLGEFLFSLVFGKEILEYFTLFYVMIWVSVLISSAHCFTTLLTAIGKLKALVVFSAIVCVLTFILSFVFIKQNGMYGAGYAMIAAFVIQIIIESVYFGVVLCKTKGVISDE